MKKKKKVGGLTLLISELIESKGYGAGLTINIETSGMEVRARTEAHTPAAS